jgi:sarcosine oxidase
MDYDVIVVGLGGMGAASADALAGRGLRVLGVDRFGVGHVHGASHGRSRIVRMAYFESPDYIPLLRRAYALWDAFPAGCRLHRVGLLTLGSGDSAVVVGATRSAAVWRIPIELLTGREVEDRFPQFALRPTDVGVFEPDAGFVRPEETVAFLTERARDRGADLVRERVVGWETAGDGVRVWTGSGAQTAGRLVLAAGSWTPALAAPLALPIRIERRVQYFFAPSGDPAAYGPDAMPTFIWDLAPGDAIYGFPADGTDGVKVGFHQRGRVIDPEHEQPPASAEEVREMGSVLADRMPGVVGNLVRSVPCLYDLTPDHSFALGLVSGLESRVVVAAGFSGHGFKFVPVVGEVVADLATTGETAYDLDFLSPARFTHT